MKHNRLYAVSFDTCFMLGSMTSVPAHPKRNVHKKARQQGTSACWLVVISMGASATLKQTEAYLKPLFKMLKKKVRMVVLEWHLLVKDLSHGHAAMLGGHH